MQIITIDVDSKNQNNKLFDTSSLDFDFVPSLPGLLDFPCTLFVRIDRQVAGKYKQILTDLRGFDIGWHPHLFKEHGDPFVDEFEIVQELDWLYKTFEEISSFDKVRLGCCQGGDQIIKWLNDRFEIDSSAMTGCKRQDNLRHYDWSLTGFSPYYPSKSNYQKQLLDNYSILEVPLTTFFVKTCYDSEPKLRTINPFIKRELWETAVNSNLERLKAAEPLVISCHADEFFDGYEDDLYRFGKSHFVRNLEYLEERVEHEIVTMEGYWRHSCSA